MYTSVCVTVCIFLSCLTEATLDRVKCDYKPSSGEPAKELFTYSGFWWPQWGDEDNEDRLELEAKFANVGTEGHTICQSDYCTFYECCVEDGDGCYVERLDNDGTPVGEVNPITGCKYDCKQVNLGPNDDDGKLDAPVMITIHEITYDVEEGGEVHRVGIDFEEIGESYEIDNKLQSCKTTKSQGVSVEIYLAEWNCEPCAAGGLRDKAPVLLQECCSSCYDFVKTNKLNGETRNDPRYVSCVGCDKVSEFESKEQDMCAAMTNYVSGYMEYLTTSVPFEVLNTEISSAFFEGYFRVNGTTVDTVISEGCSVAMNGLEDLQNDWELSFQDCRTCQGDLIEECCRKCDEKAEELSAAKSYQYCSGCEEHTPWGDLDTIWAVIGEEAALCNGTNGQTILIVVFVLLLSFL